MKEKIAVGHGVLTEGGGSVHELSLAQFIFISKEKIALGQGILTEREGSVKWTSVY
jgi:hypothetical protein